MRILHIIQRYWPARGGAETHLGELSRRFAAEGHDVTVATSDALDFELFWDPRRRRLDHAVAEHAGVRIRRFPVRHLPMSTVAYPGIQRLLWIFSEARLVPVALMHRLARFIPYVPDLWRWLRTTEEDFDIVAGMTICFDALLEAGLRFAQRKNIPFVIYPLTHLGSGEQPGRDALSRFYTMRQQMALVRSSDAVMAQTPTEQAFYAAQGVPPERVVVAGPGVNPDEIIGGDADRFRARHHITHPLVATLSSMSYDKGTVHVVEAVRRLWEAGESVDLALAGAVLDPFRHYMDSLPVAVRERVRLLGAVSEEEKRDLLAAADVLAMPSRTDSFGITYLEAWLYGKPVVGAQTWGVNEVIRHGENGLLVPFGDVSALAQTLQDLLHDPVRRAEMGRCGQAKTYRDYTWDARYPIVRDAYQRLVT